jgi:hypothetical protein
MDPGALLAMLVGDGSCTKPWRALLPNVCNHGATDDSVDMLRRRWLLEAEEHGAICHQPP